MRMVSATYDWENPCCEKTKIKTNETGKNRLKMDITYILGFNSNAIIVFFHDTKMQTSGVKMLLLKSIAKGKNLKQAITLAA